MGGWNLADESQSVQGRPSGLMLRGAGVGGAMNSTRCVDTLTE